MKTVKQKWNLKISCVHTIGVTCCLVAVPSKALSSSTGFTFGDIVGMSWIWVRFRVAGVALFLTTSSIICATKLSNVNNLWLQLIASLLIGVSGVHGDTPRAYRLRLPIFMYTKFKNTSKKTWNYIPLCTCLKIVTRSYTHNIITPSRDCPI